MKPHLLSACAAALLCALGNDSTSAQTSGPEPKKPATTAPSLPPALPIVSPVAEFRRWLDLPPAEREKALAAKSPKQRQALQAKLTEYSALPPEERDRRLGMVELHWYLHPLMQQEPSARPKGLATVPEGLRPLIQERLAQWDLLPAELKQAALAADRLKSSTPEQHAEMLSHLPPQYRQDLDAQIKRWRETPPEVRERLHARFRAFFELPEKEKDKILRTLKEGERREMEKTLAEFAKLPPHQRKLCIESFGKLAQMSPEERGQFLRNAERWEAMSPQERDTWRKLVRALPPMPAPKATMPPMPDQAPRSQSASQSTVVSNSTPGAGR